MAPAHQSNGHSPITSKKADANEVHDLTSLVNVHNVKSVLHYLRLHSDRSPEMSCALDEVIRMLQRDQQLLRAALLDESMFAALGAVPPCREERVESRVAAIPPEPMVVPLPHLLANHRTGVEKNVPTRDRVAQGCSVHFLLLNFNRHVLEFQEALLNSDLAGELSASGVDVHPPWAHGAKIFVESLTQDAVEQAGIKCDELRPWHVLVRADHEPRVHWALRDIKCRPKPRLKSSHAFYFTSTTEFSL